MDSRNIKSWDDLDWSRKTPCHDCPFLRTSPFHEGIAARAESVATSIINNTFAHTCHMTDNNPMCDGPHNWKKAKPQHCAGAIMMLLKTGRGMDLQLPLLHAASAGRLDLTEMKKRAKADKRVFTFSQFIKFNIDGMRKLLAKKRGDV